MLPILPRTATSFHAIKTFVLLKVLLPVFGTKKFPLLSPFPYLVSTLRVYVCTYEAMRSIDLRALPRTLGRQVQINIHVICASQSVYNEQ